MLKHLLISINKFRKLLIATVKSTRKRGVSNSGNVDIIYVTPPTTPHPLLHKDED